MPVNTDISYHVLQEGNKSWTAEAQEKRLFHPLQEE